jgi:hypothetical protein
VFIQQSLLTSANADMCRYNLVSSQSFAPHFPAIRRWKMLLDIPFFLTRAGIAMDRDSNQATVNEKNAVFSVKNRQLLN